MLPLVPVEDVRAVCGLVALLSDDQNSMRWLLASEGHHLEELIDVPVQHALELFVPAEPRHAD